MSRYLVLAIGVLFLAPSSWGQSDSPMAHDVAKALDQSKIPVTGPMECKFVAARICSEAECRTGPNIIEVNWNPNSGEYRRCDKKGCDTYEPTVSISDFYTVLSFPKNGMMTKISDRGEIVEIATLMNTAFVKHGQCSAVAVSTPPAQTP